MKYEVKKILSLADHRFLCRNQSFVNSNNNQYNNSKENPTSKIDKKLLVNMF